MSKAQVIALVNQKGGTGKTQSTENLGIGLANEGKNCSFTKSFRWLSLNSAICGSLSVNSNILPKI